MRDWLSPLWVDKHSAKVLGLGARTEEDLNTRLKALTSDLQASIVVRLLLLFVLVVLNALMSRGLIGFVSYGLTVTIWAVFTLSRWSMIREARRMAVLSHLLTNGPR